MDMQSNDGDPTAPRGPGSSPQVDAGATPLIAAIIAAAVGAAIWAGITHFTGYEVGFVAWGVGLLVGFAAAATGGRGNGLAVTCAILAVIAIFGGKYMSAGFVIDEVREGMLGQEVYDEFIEDSSLIGGLETDTELKGYMIERHFTDVDAVPDVTDEELEFFKMLWLPDLQAAEQDPPTYEAWRAEQATRADENTMSPMEIVQEDLSPIDIVFVLLGLVSAYKLVANND